MSKTYENKTNTLVLNIGRTDNSHILHTKSGNSTIEWTETTERNTSIIEFKLTEVAILTHPEHAPIALKPGTYSRTIQVEFNPFNDTIGYIFD